MNLKQLVTSNDDNDLRLAADLFLSNELDAASEQIFVDRLGDPQVARLLTDVVGLHVVGLHVVGQQVAGHQLQRHDSESLQDSTTGADDVLEPTPAPVNSQLQAASTLATTSSFATKVNAWSMMAITAAIALCCVWYFQADEHPNEDQTRRVAELWASRFVRETSLDSTDLNDNRLAINDSTPDEFNSATGGNGDSGNGDSGNRDSGNGDSGNGDSGNRDSGNASDTSSEIGSLEPPSWLMTAALLSVESEPEAAGNLDEQKDLP